MTFNDEEIERLYNVKLSKYVSQGIEIDDELDDILYKEAVREIITRNYINERYSRYNTL